MSHSLRSVRFTSSLLGMTGIAAVVVACSSRQPFREDDRLLQPSPEGGADQPSAVCGIHCSRDLKQVLDGCEGAETVVETCNADQGCGGGRCVDACTAAVLTKGSAGCDFWTVSPTDPVYGSGICFAALVANTWDRAVSLAAEYGDGELDISKSTYLIERKDERTVYTRLEGPLPPGQVAVVFLSDNPAIVEDEAYACPPEVTPAMLDQSPRHGPAKRKAFHIKTDAPVSVYSIAPYGGAPSHSPSATLLLPVSSWETHHVAVAPYWFPPKLTMPQVPRRTLQLVASEDRTQIRIRPIVDIVAGGEVAPHAAGTIATWTLDKGEVLQLVQLEDLAGSPIEADKPIGVFAGSEVTKLPGDSKGAADWLQQQIPPLSQWGTEYAVVPFVSRIESVSGENRREQVPYTFVGAADGTTLTYEPSRPRGAPDTLRAGESFNFITGEIFVVRSQDSKHPFHVNVYMTGGLYGAAIDAITLGDPDYVNVPPTAQYLDRYVFFTDFTYPETSLTVVRKKTPRGFMPVELECAGELTGWSPLGSEYEYAWIKLTSGFVGQKFAGGECGYGRQEARSTGPFAVTVWGIGLWASYGYVGGTGLRPVNDAPPPTVN